MTSGEDWAAEELGALLDGRFGPAAWTRFLRASFCRAAETRRARPQLARQARAWSRVGLLAGLAVCMAAPRVHGAAPRLRRFALWWLVISAMLEWHLGMVEGPDGEPREHLSAADALTLQRLWSVPFLAAQGDSARGSAPAFSALIVWAAGTDAVDGALARRVGPTRLGRDLDTVADALVVGAAARAACRAGWLSMWVAQLAVVRSALPVAYVAASYFRTGQRPLVGSLGPSRRLAPVLLGGLAAAPFSSRAGTALTGAASIASIGLGVIAPSDDHAPTSAASSRSEPRAERRASVSTHQVL